MVHAVEKWSGGSSWRVLFYERMRTDRDPFPDFRYTAQVPFKDGGVATIYFKPRGKWLAWERTANPKDPPLEVKVKAPPKYGLSEFIEMVLTEPDFGFTLPERYP